jgi:predicted nuclease of predicted toxin-antitoxin system
MPQRFKLDENLPDGLTTQFTTLGHDAATCHQKGIAGTGDSVIAAHAASEGRILVTFDLDFSDMRRFPPGSHPGIVVLRLYSQDINTCRRAGARFLQGVLEADLAGNLLVVEDTRVRIRRP